MVLRKIIGFVLLLVLGFSILPAQAYHNDYGYYPPSRSYTRQALVGAGIGALAGGAFTREDPLAGALRGAVVGTGAGLGYEYLTRNQVFSSRPLYNRPSYYAHPVHYHHPSVCKVHKHRKHKHKHRWRD